MGPPLGRAKTRIAELLGSNGQADRRLVIGLERRDTDADPRTCKLPQISRLSHVGRGHPSNLSEPIRASKSTLGAWHTWQNIRRYTGAAS